MTARLLPHDAVRRIQRRTAVAFGVTLKDILNPGRERKFVRPRPTAMFLAHWFTPHSSKVLGRIFRRDRTTVVYGVNKTLALMQTEVGILGHVRALREALSEEFQGAGMG